MLRRILFASALTLLASAAFASVASATVLPTHTLTVHLNHAASDDFGQVFDNSGNSCEFTETQCSFAYVEGSTVTLTASSNFQYSHAWSGDCTLVGENCQVTMGADKDVTVSFTPSVPSTKTLTVNMQHNHGDDGIVYDLDSGWTCSNSDTQCTHTYTPGTQVTLGTGATPNTVFSGWGGDCTNDTGNCDLDMSADRTVSATFCPPAGCGAIVSVSPPSHAFPDTVVDATATQDFVVSNTGDANLEISAILISGTSFHAADPGTTCLDNGGVVARGASCVVRIEFTPTSPGAKPGSFTIAANTDPDSVVTLSGEGAGCIGPNPEDTDHDGLPNAAETGAADLNCDGADPINLAAMGADPNHKDVFIEIDHMASFPIEQDAVQKVVDAFAAAPVANPDAQPGITLHVDNGPDSVMNPNTAAVWGARSKADVLPDQAVLGDTAAGKYVWADFDAIKQLSPDRERAFHYVISADNYGMAAVDSSTGLARGTPSSDLIVSLGAMQQLTPPQFASVNEQAGTLMHELGHTLGLRHGGADNLNNKPNYLSVMNYAFQLGGVPKSATEEIFDYSRFASDSNGGVRPLNESSLSEYAGLAGAGSPALSYYTVRSCPDGSTKRQSMAGAPDWNCDGALSPNLLSANINGDTISKTDATPVYSNSLTSIRDWLALVYTGGAIGDFGATLGTPPAETVLEEPSVQTLEDFEEVNSGPAPPPIFPPPPLSDGGSQPSGTTPSSSPASQTAPAPRKKKKTKKKHHRH